MGVEALWRGSGRDKKPCQRPGSFYAGLNIIHPQVSAKRASGGDRHRRRIPSHAVWRELHGARRRVDTGERSAR
jgi:hypothetical protein